MSNSADESAGPLAEFVALRAEVERRATVQWNVMALQIGIAGAVFGFALSAPRREILLLVVPIATYMTFGRYVSEVVYINQLGRYIRTDLTARVPGGLHWEEWRWRNLPASEIGIFARLHFTGVFFPGVATMAMAAFAVAALNNNLAAGQHVLTIVFVIVVLLIELVLTAVIILTQWRLRRYAATTPG